MIVDSPEEFSRKSYDYVIIGGGTAGLTLAARLTEDPDVQVGVLEAGQNRLADPNILIPGLVFGAIGHPEYDWMFKSTPQKSLNDRVIASPRGKVLGGSSAINGMMCTFPSKGDIDNWAALGNEGWSFDDLAPYYKKFQSFTLPSKGMADFYETHKIIDKKLHDANGPVKTSFPINKKVAGNAWVETFNKMGLEMTVDPQTGYGNGGYSSLTTTDAANSTRSYAGTAYYQPNAHRSNLTVLTQAQVSNITFTRRDRRVVANGVTFLSFGSKYHVKTDREVILCAGSIQSPQILELSGIGSKKILTSLGIDVVVENPNVGENFQDHAITTMCWQAADGVTTFDSLASVAGAVPAAINEFYATQSGLLTALITGQSNLSYQQVDQRVGHVSPEPISQLIQAAVIDAVPSLKKQYKLLGDALINPKESDYQIIYIPAGSEKGQPPGQSAPRPGSFISLDMGISRPFSRGSVHIASNDPLQAPLIDPNYLSHPLDLELFSSGTLFMQEIVTKEPLASFFKNGGKAFHPSFEYQTKETVAEFCKESLGSEYHPLGSCSMLPKKDGGVVDTKLRVYGVEGLRVVDASIMPLHIRNNIQTAVYAIAEKAADIIKGDWKESDKCKNGHKRAADDEHEHDGEKENGKKRKKD